MTRMFGVSSLLQSPPTSSHYLSDSEYEEEEEEEEEDEEIYEEHEDDYFIKNAATTPFITPDGRHESEKNTSNNGSPLIGFLLGALKKSFVTCSAVDVDDVVSTTSSMEIGSPTDVKHVSHVTFDRFNGFLGLPDELQPEVPGKVPSASVSVFGVSPESMQCSYDQRGNSVPTILLMMQKRLYSGGGLKAEGIFRINAENSQEQDVRKQLNKGFVPHGIDSHCLAGLIKAWFRELPTGILDSLTPEEVMHCNSEEECTRLIKNLPPTEAALLDWAINLMADVVNYEHDNKMNARNIAVVFAPNMTQMADPLTALIHAVQVMNLLKTLIVRTLRERKDVVDVPHSITSGTDSPTSTNATHTLSFDKLVASCQQDQSLQRCPTLSMLERESEEKFWSFHSKSEEVEEYECTSNSTPQHTRKEHGSEAEGIFERLSWRKGVKKLCRHPVFQLSKPFKKGSGLGLVNTRNRGGEAWT